MLSTITSSYLFLRRVQAIYTEEKKIQWFFFILWVLLSGSDVLILIGMDPTSIPGTHYYLDAGIPSYVAVSFFTMLLFDTSVFVAVSYKIMSAYNVNSQVPWYALISGRTLPRLSRAIFRGGQQYYL